MSKYKMVPVEPTEEMTFAGTEVYGIEECADADVHSVWEAMIAAAPDAHGPLFLSDEKILEIASNPMVTPCSPWWLKDDVKAGDVRNSAIAFARAALKAAAPAVRGDLAGQAIALLARVQSWWHNTDGDMPVSLEQDIAAVLAAHRKQGGDE